MEATLQTIFLLGYALYEQKHLLAWNVRKAAWSIMNCRTAIMGGHIQACPDGHFERNHYNSCRHRMCPKCAFIQIQKWLSKQKSRLLCCDHYHVIFTIPHELNTLWRLNTKLMANILFHCSRDTLFELLGDSKYLGAKPGIISSLHTWTKTLMLHPHIHCLVTGGGFINGEWLGVKKDFLLPYKVIAAVFQGKVRAAIGAALDKHLLCLPDEMSEQQLRNLLNKWGRKKWNVHVKEKYSHGRGVVSYLAKYIRGGPIKDSRIIKVDKHQVVFNIGREKQELLTLPLETFIGRYLQHVLPFGFIAVRYYGLYSNADKKRDYACCVELLGKEGMDEKEEAEDWKSVLERCFPQEETPSWLCPVCGKRLITKFSASRTMIVSSDSFSGNDPPLEHSKVA